MESLKHKGACISPPICTNRLIFGKDFFHLVLCEYTIRSHNFTNLNFVEVFSLFTEGLDFFKSTKSHIQVIDRFFI